MVMALTTSDLQTTHKKNVRGATDITKQCTVDRTRDVLTEPQTSPNEPYNFHFGNRAGTKACCNTLLYERACIFWKRGMSSGLTRALRGVSSVALYTFCFQNKIHSWKAALDCYFVKPLVPSTLLCFEKYVSKLAPLSRSLIIEPQTATLFTSKHCRCTSNWFPWTSKTCFSTVSRPILDACCL